MERHLLRTMSRLGMLRVTFIMTVASAFLSVAVAWLLYRITDVGDVATHLKFAFIIPFFVTPGFSFLTALSLRESRRARRAAYEMARSDPLTGVANRRAFFEIDGEHRRAGDLVTEERALLFLDIDHFKKVNDTFGHEAGDAVLVHLADILRSHVRAGDIVARFGGEEFVIMARGCDSRHAQALASRILETVRSSQVMSAGQVIRYTVSIGLAVGGPDEHTTDLLSGADAELYRVKEDGRDGARLHATASRLAARASHATASQAA